MTDSNNKRNFKELKSYWPLGVLFFVSFFFALAATYSVKGQYLLMRNFMGFFLCSFAMLKLFSLDQFVSTFRKIDLLGKRNEKYATLYPFLELFLGLGFISGFFITFISLFSILLFTFSLIGVITSLSKGMDISCPCMGGVLNVPLSTVTVVEDLLMIIMSAAILF